MARPGGIHSHKGDPVNPRVQAARLATLEAELLAARRAGDPGAAELARYVGRRRERLEMALERETDGPLLPPDPRQGGLF